MAQFKGRYIHVDDLRPALAEAGHEGILDDEPSTRRTVFVKGEPAGSAIVTIDPARNRLTVGDQDD